jgi:hypothetical protein
MNHFVELFDSKIKSFWKMGSEDEKQQLLTEIRQYANSNPHAFREDIKEVQFNNELLPLPVVLEALATDTDTWGQFYVDTLDNIFDEARQVEKPADILSNLIEFSYIEKDERPFVQSIADRFYTESNSDNLSTKLAAIYMLPAFLHNPTVRNKSSITDSLRQKLHDTNWKVRYVTFKSLNYEGLLPAGHKLSLMDQIRKLVFGAPPTV